MAQGSAEQETDLFKFYEEAAEKTKAHAWAQTTWILTLNSGILAFSLNFFANHPSQDHFLLVEGVCTAVGVVLCLFLIYLLQELGGHISHYWTSSNRLAAGNAQLADFVFPNDIEAVRAGRAAPFPPFCRRLQILAGMFAGAHVVWLVIVASL